MLVPVALSRVSSRVPCTSSTRSLVSSCLEPVHVAGSGTGSRGYYAVGGGVHEPQRTPEDAGNASNFKRGIRIKIVQAGFKL